MTVPLATAHRSSFMLCLLPILAIAGKGETTSPCGEAGPREGTPPPAPPLPWGSTGHAFATRAALEHLPRTMPPFFLAARERLEYLGPEPDRWRSRELREMNEAWTYDHYIDLENVPSGALEEPDRYAFLSALHRAGIERPQQFVGFLPWRILELYQRLLTQFAIWRNTPPGPQRGHVEARIVNDAGLLGHFAADAAQPHHTTIHFNGWAEGAPNPEGYTTDRGFHARFESAFINAHLAYEDVEGRISRAPDRLTDPRAAVWDHVRESHARVEALYRLEKEHGFGAGMPAHPEAVSFAAERLAAGAEVLRDLWWTAWVASEGLAEERRAEGWR